MEEEKEINKIVSITKEELAELPMESYTNGIIVVDTPEQVEQVASVLRNENLIGFDTETKPSFKRGQLNKVALLQLSTHNECFLIRLNKLGMPESIKDILEDENILKIGLSIHDDFHSLNKICAIDPKGFIELQGFVKDYKIADNSLARIYGILFNKRISKGQRLTNWEADELSIHQQEYASLDALACINIYETLMQGRFNPEHSPYYREPVDPNKLNQTAKDAESKLDKPANTNRQETPLNPKSRVKKRRSKSSAAVARNRNSARKRNTGNMDISPANP